MTVKQKMHPSQKSRPLRIHGDMASCATEICPSFGLCWRAQKPASYYQSYSMFTPVGDKCDDFIGIVV